jgi:hypothetical protein
MRDVTIKQRDWFEKHTLSMKLLYLHIILKVVAIGCYTPLHTSFPSFHHALKSYPRHLFPCNSCNKLMVLVAVHLHKKFDVFSFKNSHRNIRNSIKIIIGHYARVTECRMYVTMTCCGSMPFFPKLFHPISLYDVACFGVLLLPILTCFHFRNFV